ncbi:hypothetical protein TNCV_69111 [Trichonephila clavipes]|nr:hypothetical protein TNCV_69111 [Trichonephila clavipes]
MVLKLDPQTRNKILKLLKDVCSNSVINKAFKKQKRHFVNGLLSKLEKKYNLAGNQKLQEKWDRKEFVTENKKKKLKRLIAAENPLPPRSSAKKQ